MSAMLHIRKNVFCVDQAEMAGIAGVAQSTISRWEAGLGAPGLDVVSRVRAEAKLRKLRWTDQALFDPPALSPLNANPSPEIGA